MQKETHGVTIASGTLLQSEKHMSISKYTISIYVFYLSKAIYEQHHRL